MKVTVIPIVTGTLGTILPKFGKGTGRLKNNRTSGDHPDYNTRIGQNTEKSLGDLRDLLSLKLQCFFVCLGFMAYQPFLSIQYS